MGALGVQQDLVAARQEVGPRPRRLHHARVLGDGAEREARHGRVRREVVAHAHEVEVRRDEDERPSSDVSPATIATAALRESGNHGAREVREPGVGIRRGRRGLEAGEGLAHPRATYADAEVLDGAGVLGGLDAGAAGPVLAAQAAVQLGELGAVEGGEDDGLAEVGGAAVEAPLADAGEVAAVRVAGLAVEVGQQGVLDVLPVLHEEGVGLVDDDELDRAEEVVVHGLLVLLGPDGHTQAQGARQDHVGVVERREVLDRLARELHPDPEHVVVVALEELAEVLRPICCELGVAGVRVVRVVEPLPVLLLVRHADRADRLHHVDGRLPRRQDHEDLGPREPLVSGLEVRPFPFSGQLGVVLDYAIARPVVRLVRVVI